MGCGTFSARSPTPDHLLLITVGIVAGVGFSLGDHVGHLLEPVDGNPPHQLEHWVSFGDVHDLKPGHEA